METELLNSCFFKTYPFELGFFNQYLLSILDALAYVTVILLFFSGDYSLESLLEMIALHLESTYPESNMREFA